VAVGALNERLIDPEKVVNTEGFISIPNPYDPENETIFRDWKDHGDIDMEEAIAISSNVYFFIIGGGYENQEGLGIKRIEEYSKLFGFGEKTNIGFEMEETGLIPTPEWKEEFSGDIWRVGDTYNTSIGQYSFQVTLLQVVRAIAAIATEGILVEPTLELNGNTTKKHLNINDKNFEIVKEGMRSAVTYGTASGLSIPGVSVAAKTGTAEIDYGKKYVNSWVTGFFPYEDPKYAFAVVMEQGPRENYIGSVFVMRQLFDWMKINKPEYLK
jgi:penicillin-binding protein 2